MFQHDPAKETKSQQNPKEKFLETRFNKQPLKVVNH